jgi:hypothetical protein
MDDLGEAHRVAPADGTGVHDRGVDAGARLGMAVAHGDDAVVIRQHPQGPGVPGERAVLKGRNRAARRPGHHVDHQVRAGTARSSVASGGGVLVSVTG